MSGHPEELFTVEDIIEEAKEDMMLWADDNYLGQDTNGTFFASMFYRYLENIINAYENNRFKNG